MISNALADYVYNVLFRRYRLKLPISWEIVEKGDFGPGFLGGISQIAAIHFQITFTSENVASFG